MSEQSYLENIASDELSPEELYSALKNIDMDYEVFWASYNLIPPEPELLRRVFVLRWNGLTNAEIAEKLGVSISTVRRRRAELRKIFATANLKPK